MKKRPQSRTKGRRDGGRAETRSGTPDTAGFTSGQFALPTQAGPTVTAQTSLTIAALWNAVNIYANAIGYLKFYVAEYLAKGGHKPAVDNDLYDLLVFAPNKVNTAFRYKQSGMGHVMTHGNWYSEIERDRYKIPVAFHLQDPKNIRPFVDEEGELCYELKREGRIIEAKDMLHVAGLGWDGVIGYSPVSMARETLGLAIAEQSHTASLMGNNAVPTGHLEYPGKLPAKSKGDLRDNWNKLHQGPDRKGNLAILDNGMKWVMESFSPADAELILCRGFSIAEIARIYNLPQHMLGLLDHATFSNIEEQHLAFYQDSLTPWLETIVQEWNAKLLTREDRRTYVVAVDSSALLRGNTAARTAYYDSLFAKGAITPNEIRIREGMNPSDEPGMDHHYLPTNNLTALEVPILPPALPSPAPSTVPDADESNALRALAIDLAVVELMDK